MAMRCHDPKTHISWHWHEWSSAGRCQHCGMIQPGVRRADVEAAEAEAAVVTVDTSGDAHRRHHEAAVSARVDALADLAGWDVEECVPVRVHRDVPGPIADRDICPTVREHAYAVVVGGHLIGGPRPNKLTALDDALRAVRAVREA